MSKKGFEDLKESNPAVDAATVIVKDVQETETKPEETKLEEKKPEETKASKVLKNARLNLLVTPQMMKDIKALAHLEDSNVNRLINGILEKYVNENQARLDLWHKTKEANAKIQTD